MKKTRLLTISVIVSLLLTSYVSASWFDDYDYYEDNNYENLYDYMNHKKEAYDDKKTEFNDYKSEFYQINVKSWLYKNDDAYIIGPYDINKNDYNQIKSNDEVIVYVKPSTNNIKKKIIYKKQIKQIMCDFYKCYIEYKEYYQ